MKTYLINLEDILLNLWRGRRPIKYIFFEMLTPFILKTCIFTSLISLFASLQYFNSPSIHVPIKKLFHIISLSHINALPIALIMALLSTVLLTYRRLDSQLELTTLKTLGFNQIHYLLPAFALGILAFSLSVPTLLYWAPSINSQIESIKFRLPEKKYTQFIKEGVFSRFFDFTVYVQRVDSESEVLENMFIYYSGTKNEQPFIITAQRGKLSIPSLEGLQENQWITAFLNLSHGSIYKADKESYTQINFQEHKIKLTHQVPMRQKIRRLTSYSIDEIQAAIKHPQTPPNRLRKLSIEFHYRWTLATICLIFSVLGVGLGMRSQHRVSSSTGIIPTIAILFTYITLSVILQKVSYMETLPIPPPLTMWTSNTLFALLAVRSLKSVH